MAKKVKSENDVVSMPEAQTVEVPPVSTAEHTNAIEFLRTECLVVEYEIGWFSRSRSADAATKSTMAAAVEGTVDGFSVTRRLFASKHPAVKELNRLRSAIDDFRNSMTVVMSRKPSKRVKVSSDGLDEIVDAEAADDGDTEASSTSVQARGRIARGMRLIRKVDVQAFWDGFWARVGDMMRQAEVVQECLEEIKQFDRQSQGSAFNESDYPEDLRSSISVNGPYFSSFAVTMELPPEIYQAQLEDINKQLSSSVSVAADNIAAALMEAFADLSDQLVNRHHVQPMPGSGLQSYSGAELLKVRPAPDKDGVKMVEVMLRREEKTPGKTTGAELVAGKVRRVEESIYLPADQWQALLRPTVTTARRKLSVSSVEKVLALIENFDKVKAMLGSYGAQFDAHMNDVRTFLSRLTQLSDGTIDGVADALRDTTMYRKDLASLLSTAAAGMAASAEAVQSTRRLLNKEYVGQV